MPKKVQIRLVAIIDYEDTAAATTTGVALGAAVRDIIDSEGVPGRVRVDMLVPKDETTCNRAPAAARDLN